MDCLTCPICQNDIDTYKYIRFGCCADGLVCMSCFSKLDQNKGCPVCRSAFPFYTSDSCSDAEPEKDFTAEHRRLLLERMTAIYEDYEEYEDSVDNITLDTFVSLLPDTVLPPAELRNWFVNNCNLYELEDDVVQMYIQVTAG